MPPCLSISSTRVVLPWSTCAIMATFLSLVFCTVSTSAKTSWFMTSPRKLSPPGPDRPLRHWSGVPQEGAPAAMPCSAAAAALDQPAHIPVSLHCRPISREYYRLCPVESNFLRLEPLFQLFPNALLCQNHRVHKRALLSWSRIPLSNRRGASPLTDPVSVKIQIVIGRSRSIRPCTSPG